MAPDLGASKPAQFITNILPVTDTATHLVTIIIQRGAHGSRVTANKHGWGDTARLKSRRLPAFPRGGQLVTAERIIPLPRANALETIAQAGFIVGVLDGLDAIVFFCWIEGVPVVRLFQHIASGMLGKKSFEGGLATAFLGVGFHFLVATGAAATYYILALRFPELLKKPVLYGPIFGLGVYAFMYNVVIPLCAAPKQPPASLSKIVNELIAHILFVGLPIALVVSRSLRSRR